MKKFVKGLWIAAACMAGLGILITTAGFMWSMRVVDRLTPEKSVPMTLPMDMMTVKELSIDLGVGDVRFAVDDEARIEATGFREEDLEIVQDGKAVRVKGRDPLGGTHLINLGIFRVDWLGRVHVGTLEERVVTVYLPKRIELETLDVKVSVGDATGKIIGHIGNAAFKSSTGDLEIEDFFCETLRCDYGTGNITLENVNVLERADIFCNTGDVTCTSCEWKALAFDGGTGEVLFEDCKALENASILHNTDDLSFRGGSWKDLAMEAGTCNVKFDGHLEGTCRIETSTGDVKLHLDEKSEKYSVKMHTSTGNCDVENAPLTQMEKDEYAINPGADAENLLEIEISTGDIEVVFAKE